MKNSDPQFLHLVIASEEEKENTNEISKPDILALQRQMMDKMKLGLKEENKREESVNDNMDSLQTEQNQIRVTTENEFINKIYSENLMNLD